MNLIIVRVLAALLIAFPGAVILRAAPATQPAKDADQAWRELVELGQLPQPPESWKDREPSEQEVERFQAAEAQRLTKAAEAAKEFQARYPADPRAEQAQTREYQLLDVLLRLGNTNVLTRLETLDGIRLKNPKLPEDERVYIRAGAVHRKAMARLSEGRAVALGELEKGARTLLQEFPQRPEGFEMLQTVALGADPEKAQQLALELSRSAAPEPVKEAVKPLLLLGKPLSLKFTAVDGRVVDLEKLRGKVVLLDFWATWCEPCVREIPNVRAAYQKLQSKGFEIIGISFDENRQRLLGFVKEQNMPWPHYFDGKQWENELGKKFGIQSLPSMWLVDRKGNLRDLNAGEELANKVQKLLAESR